MKELFRSWCK